MMTKCVTILSLCILLVFSVHANTKFTIDVKQITVKPDSLAAFIVKGENDGLNDLVVVCKQNVIDGFTYDNQICVGSKCYRVGIETTPASAFVKGGVTEFHLNVKTNQNLGFSLIQFQVVDTVTKNVLFLDTFKCVNSSVAVKKGLNRLSGSAMSTFTVNERNESLLLNLQSGETYKHAEVYSLDGHKILTFNVITNVLHNGNGTQLLLKPASAKFPSAGSYYLRIVTSQHTGIYKMRMGQ